MSILSSDLKNPRFADFSKILEPLGPHIEALDAFLHDQLAEFEPEVQDMVAYALEHRGKRLRPILTFYSGWKEGRVYQENIRLAAALELIHLASLVHDDVLDEADLRHNSQTVSAKYGAKEAILLGDTLFAQALKLSADFPDPTVCRRVTECTRKLCSGEIVQTFHRGGRAYELETYYRVIDLKTAELFAVACELGSYIAGKPQDYTQALTTFGQHLGRAYQIYDDLSDIWGSQDHIGKTLGTDFLTGKWTLPFILFNQGKGSNLDLDQNFLKALKNDPSVLKESLEIFNSTLNTALTALDPYKSFDENAYLIGIHGVISSLRGRFSS